jgi:1-phosphofructokinase family hexose kinase
VRIITVTVNPILDRTLSVAQLRPGEFHRAQVLRQELCGKGITVTRALAALGIPSKVLGFIGGITGEAFKSGLTAEGFDIDFIDVSGETRHSTLILDERSGQYTKINEPGPTVSLEHMSALQTKIEAMAQPGDIWVFSGSLPPGAPDDFYADLIQRAQERGARAFLDSSGTAFNSGMRARPFGVKPNSDEAAEFFGQALDNDDDHSAAIDRFLRNEGVEVAAITRGVHGLVLGIKSAEREKIVFAIPPHVEVRSPVAAGDSALAGILWGMADGCDPAEIARRSVACGTATAMQEGSGIGSRALVERLLAQVEVREKTLGI